METKIKPPRVLRVVRVTILERQTKLFGEKGPQMPFEKNSHFDLLDHQVDTQLYFEP